MAVDVVTKFSATVAAKTLPCRVAAQAEFRDSLRNQWNVILAVVQPIVYLVLASSAPTGNGATRTTALVGAVTMAMWSTTQWTAGSVVIRELSIGTFRAILARPTSILAVISAKSFGVAAAGVAMAVPSSVVAALLLGTNVSVSVLGVLALMAVPAMLSGMAMGVLLSTLVVVTRAGGRLIATLTFPMLLLGGFLIPLSVLPPLATWFATLVPLHWLAVIMSDLLNGLAPSLPDIAMLTVLSLMYWELGRRLLKVAVRRILVRGELDAR